MIKQLAPQGDDMGTEGSQRKTRRDFIAGIAGSGAAVVAVGTLSRKAGTAMAQEDKVLATLKVSDHKDLEKVGGFVLIPGKGDGDLMVIRTGDGKYAALSNVCPHRQCRVKVVSPTLIQCPCHQSAYKIDGTYVSGPAKTGLKTYAIAVEGDSITVTRN